MAQVPSQRRIFDFSTWSIIALVVFAGTVVYVRKGGDAVMTLLVGDLDIFFDTMPKVLAGTFIGAFVALVLPRELVARWVGAESGFTGILVATLFGVVLPGGPFTIYPVSAAFLVLGADAGAAVAFITSWTLLGYTRALIWELPFMGLDFVSWRVLIALPMPILAGCLARVVARRLKLRPPAA
ncbi:MAG: permease [Pseudorhodoplanes sp.]